MSHDSQDQTQVDELQRDIVLELQRTPGEFTIYTIMAEEAVKRIMPHIEAHYAKREREALSTVDRFEVIDETGRAYVRGSIYGDPVSVELSYQDDGRTLKAFVSSSQETLKEKE